MAYAIEVDPFNELNENLRCSVCLEVLKDPRTLPCLHSFCKDCLEGIVKTRRDKAPRELVREFNCPNCREPFTLEPDKQVADMARNYFICNMVEATGLMNRGIVPCSHNCRKSFSVSRCVTCEKFLCVQCLEAHNDYRGHENHTVLTMEELSKPENRKKISGKMYCDEHKGKTLKVYCETCDQLICKHCMDFKHTKLNHSCFLIKDVANAHRENVGLKNKAMETSLTEGEDHVSKLSAATAQLDHDAENARSMIVQQQDAVIKTLTGVVKQKAETLLNEVNLIYAGERAKLDGQTEVTKRYVDNINRSVQLSRNLIDSGTDEEVISSQKMIVGNARNVLKKRPSCIGAPVHVAALSYTPSKAPIKEITVMLANCMGEVTGGNTNIGREPQDVAKSDDIIKLPTDEKCLICLSPYTNRKTLDKCGHSFCTKCIDEAFKVKRQCPTCGQLCDPLIGNQPVGEMIEEFWPFKLPGYKSCGTIQILYRFPDGMQGPNHPSPGQPYDKAMITAYLPSNTEGRKVLRLLRKAFDQKLMFTIGNTEDDEDCIVLTDIPLKTSQFTSKDSPSECYPDKGYLKKVQEILATKGITE